MLEIYKTILEARKYANALAKEGVPWKLAEVTAATKFGLDYPEAGLPSIEKLAGNGLTPCCTENITSSSRKTYGLAEYYPSNDRKLSLRSRRRTLKKTLPGDEI